jgi:hypothetical protein
MKSMHIPLFTLIRGKDINTCRKEHDVTTSDYFYQPQSKILLRYTRKDQIL